MKRAFNSPNDITIPTQQPPQSRNTIPRSPIEQQSHHSSEDEFLTLIQRIEGSAFFRTRSRHVKIKLQSWLEILSRNEFNSVWRENKLNYLKLLTLMCHCEYLVYPFTGFPKEDALPLLQKHQIDRIIDQVEKEVRGSKLTTKRQNNSVTDPRNNHHARRNAEQVSIGSTHMELGRSFQGKEHLRSKKNKEIDRFTQYKGNVVTHKKQKIQIVLQKQSICKASPSVSIEKKGTKFRQSRQNQSTVKYKTIHLPIFNADFDQNDFGKRKQHQQAECMKPSPKRPHLKSIVQSVSIQLSPISVSSKIWQITHKKQSKHVLMNRTFDHNSKNNPTTVESSKNPRISHPLHRYDSAQEDDYSTGEALKVPKKQYWQTNTYTGNGTPRYINSLNQMPNISIDSSEPINSLLQQDMECCYCEKFGVF